MTRAHDLDLGSKKKIKDNPSDLRTRIDWYQAGERDWELSLTTGRTSDDEPEHENAVTERDLIRAHIPNLTDTQLREYLNGLFTGMEPFFWDGL